MQPTRWRVQWWWLPLCCWAARRVTYPLLRVAEWCTLFTQCGFKNVWHTPDEAHRGTAMTGQSWSRPVLIQIPPSSNFWFAHSHRGMTQRMGQYHIMMSYSRLYLYHLWPFPTGIYEIGLTLINTNDLPMIVFRDVFCEIGHVDIPTCRHVLDHPWHSNGVADDAFKIPPKLYRWWLSYLYDIHLYNVYMF